MLQFVSQTVFACLMIGYSFANTNKGKNPARTWFFILGLIVSILYILAYLYLFFAGRLNGIQTVVFFGVICFFIYALRRRLSEN